MDLIHIVMYKCTSMESVRSSSSVLNSQLSILSLLSRFETTPTTYYVVLNFFHRIVSNAVIFNVLTNAIFRSFYLSYSSLEVVDIIPPYFCCLTSFLTSLSSISISYRIIFGTENRFCSIICKYIITKNILITMVVFIIEIADFRLILRNHHRSAFYSFEHNFIF